ncbi:hypothetical protein L7E55_15480 [Pelotomaculum isophthalicicum JI]|uniref:Uncharacterized protein n=1 Tax=Pelotomaculum isophthalicicum JI TaxID=947010 RepID=A0A9X4JWR3_9FIRM|nr:CBO0543 family protein [Pelotomaculum isophthalicicum]MDF9409733.1 hypothetical protein [Pelotomaculum isophthalicicum JI]
MADKKRWRELFIVSILASFLGCITDEIMHHYTLWQYKNGHPLLINMADDFGVYAVVTYLFIQWLPKNQTFQIMFGYLLAWTSFAISIELLYYFSNHLVYYQWWNSWHSYVADWFLFLLFYQFHKVFNLKELSQKKEI